MAAVASRPSISGICTSISTRSKLAGLGGTATASRPLLGHGDRVTFAFEQCDGQLLIHQTVFGQEDTQIAPLSPGGTSDWPAVARCFPKIPSANSIASRSSDCLIGLRR